MARKTEVIGEVQNFRERVERKGSDNSYGTTGSDTIVWTFNLMRFDEGEQLPPVPVEMRGQSFSGFLNEGDQVQLIDRWKGKDLHRTKHVKNLTTGIEVRAKNHLNLGCIVSVIILLVILALVILGSTGAFG